jgi:ribosome biogenesis GTPase / thiamine phosphate phosphatase
MIELYGWSAKLQNDFAAFFAVHHAPARVLAQHRGLWRLVTREGEVSGRLSGRFQLKAGPGEHPVVGDWVSVALPDGEGDAVIHGVLPRRGVFARRAAGEEHAQVVAANVDTAFLVAGMTADLNLRRLERYLVAARDGGVAPVIVLTKTDLSDAVEETRALVAQIAIGAPVLAVSALTGEGIEALRALTPAGETVALLGSSGAGKSTLLNALAGEALMATGAVREDDQRGRHTTRHRELFRLPGGALVIDTPGMRELGLLADEEALDATFADIAALPHCRFSDCSHGSEPGCAVRAALESGALSEARWRAYLKLQREMEFAEARDKPEVEAARRDRWKRIHKDQRARQKHRRRNEEKW